MLKAMGIEDEKIEQIIDAHVETVDALKEKATQYEADAQKLPTVQKELDDLKKQGGDWQKKYEDEHRDFEAYKTEQTAKETTAAKKQAYKQLIIDAGISEKRADTILKVTNLDDIELDDKGAIKDADKHKQTVKTEYAEFVTNTTVRGAHVATPPANGGSQTTKTKEEILAIKDGTERRKAMAENPTLFGITVAN
jgi:hypothetical protein